MTEDYCSVVVAVGLVPGGAVAVAVGGYQESVQVAVPARRVDVDGHLVVEGETGHGGEGVEPVGVAAPAPVEVVLVVVVVAVEDEGVAAIIAVAGVLDGATVVDFVAYEGDP